MVFASDAALLLDAAGPPAGGGAGAAVQLAALPAPGVAAAPLLLHRQCHHHREPHGQVPGYSCPLLFLYISSMDRLMMAPRKSVTLPLVSKHDLRLPYSFR